MALDSIDQERQLPRDIEAEQAVLGSIFFDETIFPEILGILNEHDFYSNKHKIIFNVLKKIADQDENIDFITVRNELSRQQNLENIGGVDYLLALIDFVPTAANAVYYANIVLEKSILRKLIQTATKIVQSGYEQKENLETILDKAEQAILSISDNQNRSGFIRISDVLGNTVEQLEVLAKQKGFVTGIPTGYIDLDRMTTGLHPEELIIIAARPAVGKTAFVLNVAQNVATKANGVVAIFSLEMGVESLVNRMLCAEGSIDAGNMRTGNLTSDEWNNLFIAMGSLGRSDIYIDDTAGIKINEIRAKCRKLAQDKKRIDLIVIDYLQLIESSGRENRQQEVSEISRQLKKLAKELKVPIIALSQLSRGVEQRQDKRPMLSDIRESGSIEQDADIVAFLYREDYYQREGSEDEPQVENNIVEVIVEKNRSGARGTVKLLFKKEFNKFSSVTYIPEH
ncbi:MULTISPECIES: replicative DNA helicase [unclassified Granulicatella]|uniref:replicative DNA helicase n=1 Tax=unclassified Granulicatella TaxID=2630493 RepID=UPI0010740583|nr:MULTISPECIES: replicative DNA helicase [unclassified Granulicatella]MBF0780335.1 replicative DNA helicase [Granulicatella sp. 19428wC4_WM01]TFU95514.1 replicative DNA helicase [Granulicatella sp. WM01]